MKNSFPFLIATYMFMACNDPVPVSSFEAAGLCYQVIPSSSEDVEVAQNLCIEQDTVVIPSVISYQQNDYHVVRIADSAFSSCQSHLTTVILEDGVESIGRAAFMDCDALTSVQLPKGLKTIGEDAFSGCCDLRGWDFPQGLEQIGAYAFRSCLISEFKAPETLGTVGEYAFYKKGLEDIVLNENVDTIGSMAFAGNIGLQSLTLPRQFRVMGEGAFSGNGMTALVVPGTWDSIPKRCFEESPNLQDLTLEEGIERIGDEAFSCCPSLSVLTLPRSMKRVGGNAFDMTALRSITIKNPETVLEKGALKITCLLYTPNVVVHSEHPEVATVDLEGNVSINGTGRTRITVQAKDAESGEMQTATCCIRVG